MGDLAEEGSGSWVTRVFERGILIPLSSPPSSTNVRFLSSSLLLCFGRTRSRIRRCRLWVQVDHRSSTSRSRILQSSLGDGSRLIAGDLSCLSSLNKSKTKFRKDSTGCCYSWVMTEQFNFRHLLVSDSKVNLFRVLWTVFFWDLPSLKSQI